jgi:photosystem II stability/assembly factor-like uncharacterized protein
MASRAKPSRKRNVCLYVGTRKGGFLFRSGLRRQRWTIEGPFFAGWEVNHLMPDVRNDGKRWRKASAGLAFGKDRGLSVGRVWHVAPDRESRPRTLWCGVDPAGLFRSDDGAKNWYEVTGLTQHPSRKLWQPGGGGLMVHTILPDPGANGHIYAAISAAGCFRSDDDGQTWHPKNRGAIADFQPDKFPEVGQCVHKMDLHPAQPETLFQQNHCGVYRSDDAGENWVDISEGVPSRFGFPMAVHPHEPRTMYVVPEISPYHRYVPDAKFAVYRSRNAGKTWRKLNRGLPQKHAYVHVLRDAMATDSCEDAGIYVGTASGEIFYSRDAGDHWELLHAQLPSVFSLEAVVV